MVVAELAVVEAILEEASVEVVDAEVICVVAAFVVVVDDEVC